MLLRAKNKYVLATPDLPPKNLESGLEEAFASFMVSHGTHWLNVM